MKIQTQDAPASFTPMPKDGGHNEWGGGLFLKALTKCFLLALDLETPTWRSPSCSF